MQNTEIHIDFIGLGMGRSGSTWINHCLSEHPAIWMPPKLKIHFFGNDAQYAKGMDFYCTFFQGAPEGKVVGENTPNYFSQPQAAGRIRASFPNVKLFVCIRDPFDVALSRYHYIKAKEQEIAPTFLEALKRRPGRYTQTSLYGTHLKNYYTYFPREQIKILWYDDLQRDPIAFIQELYGYLGVDDTFIPESASGIINASTMNEKLVIIPFFNAFLNFFRRNHANPVVRTIRMPLHAIGITHVLNRLRHKNKRKFSSHKQQKDMDNASRALLTTYLEAEIKEFGRMTGRDLSHWLV